MQSSLEVKTGTSALKEYAEKRNLKPEYQWLGVEGRSNTPTFTCRVDVGDLVRNVVGTGSSKMNAKHDASFKALEQLTKMEAEPKADSKSASSETGKNYVGELQEYAQKKGLPTSSVKYDQTSEDGPPHARKFTFSVQLEGKTGTGTSPSKKDAKHSAAKDLLRKLDVSSVPLPQHSENSEEDQDLKSKQGGNALAKDNGPEADGNGRFQSRFEQDFECVGVLGKGSYGVVFEAQNLLDEAHYGVKRVTLPKNKESEKKILREVIALAKVNHPNIVRYHYTWKEVHPAGWQKGIDKQYNISDDSLFEESECSSSNSVVFEASKGRGQENMRSGSSTRSKRTKTSSEAKQHYAMEITSSSQETDAENESEVMTDASQEDTEAFLFIQMELCSKTSLKDWLEQNSHERNYTKVGKMFQQMVKALDCLHSENLMHRDLKPANIFLTENESVKIGDFGLVREVVQEAQQVSGCTQSASSKQPGQHSQGVGTELYMSPEQDSTKSYDCKVDIFSLGLIYLELLHPCCTAHERGKVIGDARMQKFPSNFVEKWPEEHAMIVKMTSSDPDQRPSSKEILKDILYKINKND